MSALDQAFIKAYAKESLTPTAESVRPAATATAEMQRTARELPKQAAASPVIDQIYADGALYRLEAASRAGGSPVPAPHFDTDRHLPRTTARRLARRVADMPSAVEPPAEPAVAEPQPSRARRTWSKSIVEVARRLAFDGPAEVAGELAPEIVVQPGPRGPEPATGTKSPITHPEPEPWSSPAPLNVMVHATWDTDQAAWANNSVTVLDPSADWTKAAQLRAVEVDLAALPAPPVAAAPPKIDPANNALSHEHCAPVASPKRRPTRPTPGRLLRIDGAHTLADNPPHRKPIAPASEPVKPIETPKPVDAAPAPLEAVVAPQVEPPKAQEAKIDASKIEPPKTEEVKVEAVPSETPAPAKRTCVPQWEVDRFLWPETCERLVHDEQSYFSQAGSKLLAALRDGLKTLAVTGSRRGEGRSTLALCLARAAAQAGVQVAVVDADFSRPQLASMIGLDVTHSWQDAAIGKIPLSEAAIKSLSDKVTVLALDGATAGSALSLADPRITATLRALAATFELVILDLGPMTPGNEPVFPAGEACPIDAAVVVRDLRYASQAETRAIGERLHAAGIEAVGVAENFVAP